MTRSLQPRNIVVYADDDRDDIELVQDAFSQFAHNVEVPTFSDGSATLDFLHQLTEFDPLPCLIILDINMPVLTGKETLVRLRQIPQYADVPVVLFTTSSLPADRLFAQQHNAGFVTKPLGFAQMEMITRQFIDHCTTDTQKRIRRGPF